METGGNGHLSADEIAEVLGGDDRQGLSAERRHHARTCVVCERMIAMHQEQERKLRSLAPSVRTEAAPDCPEPAVWASLAAGQTDPAETDTLLDHACGCDACGALLRAAAQDFSDQTSDAESRELGKLASASPDWQHALARRMARESSGSPTVRLSPWLARAAAAVLALAGSWWGYQQWFRTDPAKLIAQAYTSQRPFDLRIAGAGHAPVRIERRGAGSPFERPRALLDAEASIARELENDRDSARWLDLRARAEMLTWDAETAIATLQHALDRKPDDPDLLADLGLAYALRAEAANRDVDYGYSIEYLSRSLKAKPNFPEAVFNRAVVFERMYLYEEAVREWRRYLEIDTAGPWREEAQRRLAGLEQKKSRGRKP